VQLVVPYFRPFGKPLNYLEYKKYSDPNAHVRVFKAIIKAYNEMLDEEITNLLNLTLRDNALNNVTIICKIIPIVDL
jgi:hypothetical protein